MRDGSDRAQLQLIQVGLQTRIGSRWLLQDVSVDLQVGERVAIVGASGSGKTSLLRLLNRLSEATTGTIRFDGQDIRQIPVIDLRQQITLVPQESKLLNMTVRQALTYPLTLRQWPKSTIQSRLTDWIERMQVPTDWLDRSEVMLSVGQRQWVALTRALLLQPKVLLLDEPTSALDVGRATQLLTILTDLARSHHTTILMVNHQLDLAQQFGDRLLQLQQGQLIQNVPMAAVDWPALQHGLVAANRQESDEWGE